MPLPRLIFLTGLGIDARIFAEQSQLPARLEFLESLPFAAGESVENYAARMAATIDPTPPFILIGLSFGGMLAREMSHRLRPQAVIAISAATAFEQMAKPVQLACHAMRYLSDTAVRRGLVLAPLLFRLVGRPDRQQRRLLQAVTDNANVPLARQAAIALTRWRLTAPPPVPTYHVHGSMDRIIPAQNLPRVDLLVPGAGHIVNLTHAEVVNRFINRIAGATPSIARNESLI